MKTKKAEKWVVVCRVRCVSCNNTRDVPAGEKDVPMCDSCYSPMLPTKGIARAVKSVHVNAAPKMEG